MQTSLEERVTGAVWGWVKQHVLASVVITLLPFILIGVGIVGFLFFLLLMIVPMSSSSVSYVGLPTNVKPGVIPSQFVPMLSAAGERYRVPMQFLAGEAAQESTFNPNATNFNDTIPTHAGGMFQFEPETWSGSNDPDAGPTQFDTNPANIARYGGYGVDANGDGTADPFDPADAAMAAAKYLGALYKDYHHSWAMASFYYGSQTQAYVASVMKYTASFLGDTPPEPIGANDWFLGGTKSHIQSQTGTSVTIAGQEWDPIIATDEGQLNIHYATSGDTLSLQTMDGTWTYQGNLIAFANAGEVKKGDVIGFLIGQTLKITGQGNPLSQFGSSLPAWTRS
jgi:hypothetical protein